MSTEVTSDHIEQAIRDFDSGIPHGCGSSAFYDLVHDDRPYPPKAI